jgi:hypothetical protein
MFDNDMKAVPVAEPTPFPTKKKSTDANEYPEGSVERLRLMIRQAKDSARDTHFIRPTEPKEEDIIDIG